MNAIKIDISLHSRRPTAGSLELNSRTLL